MKKVTYLLVLLFPLVLMSTSCSKDEDDPIPNGITVNDLVGDWNFVSLEFNNVVYDTETELAELDLTYSYIQLSFLNVTTTTIGLLDHRSGGGIVTEWDYEFSNNTIDVYANGWSGGFVFHIENWETFDGTVLKLKLMSSKASNQAPIGGVYTMTR